MNPNNHHHNRSTRLFAIANIFMIIGTLMILAPIILFSIFLLYAAVRIWTG